VFFGDASSDALTFAFETSASFAAEDADAGQDVYRAVVTPQQPQQPQQPVGGGSGGAGSGASSVAGVSPASPAVAAPAGPDARRAIDRVRPVLSRLRLAARRLRRGRAASLRFRLSEAARVRITVTRLGRRRRAVRRTASVRRAGASRLRLSTRGLRRGSYEIRLVATDAAGNVSRPVTARLRVT
jgi:hypothetical protein